MAGSIPEPCHKQDDVIQVAELVHLVAQRIRRAANTDLEPTNLRPAHLRALRTIGRQREPIRMSELADELGIVRRSATSVVDDLYDRGLIARLDDPDDRRAVLIELTPLGRSTLAAIRRSRRTAAGDVLGALSPDELGELRVLLERLRA